MNRSRFQRILAKSLPPIALSVLLSLPALAQFIEINPGLARPPFPVVAWGDYDSDGDLDVLIAGEGRQDTNFSTIYKNTGGTFADSGISLLGLARASAAWGDFDNDGDLDLAMTGETSNGGVTTRVYQNNGQTFAVIPGSFTAVFAGNVTWADYDGDGDLDLLVTGVTSSSPSGQAATRLYRNDAGAFTSVAHPFPDCYLGAVAWGDYDNDGDLDVLISGTSSGGALLTGVWRNDGGAFVSAEINLPGMDLGFAVWGDSDNDGDLDLLFGGNSTDGSITRLYHNQGGTFVDANAQLLGLLWTSAAWGDYDNDGDLDAMVIGYDPVAQTNRSILYRNDAGALVNSGMLFHNLFLGTVAWMDYDNDTDLDLLLAGNESGAGDYLRIIRNDGTARNDAPGAPSNLAASVNGTNVVLSWAAGSDGQTPVPGLTYNVRVGTTPGGSEIVASHSSSAGYRRLAAAGNSDHALVTHLRRLTPGTTYFWGVQTVDTAYGGSSFAVGGSFTTPAIFAEPASNVTFTREGSAFRAVWRGSPGAVYGVETSENLSSWSSAGLRTAAEATGLFEYLDTPGAGTSKRFYRAVRP